MKQTLMLKVELHVHTRFSSDCATPVANLVARCQEVGTNCVAITDHNTIEGALAVREIAPFPVIIGEEIKSSGGEIIGLFLTKKIDAGLSPMETVYRIKSQGGLVAIPHPFDRMRRSVITPAALKELLPHTDIIEAFNARNTFRTANTLASALAREKGLLTSAVSDAHTLIELGRTYVEMPEFDGSPDQFKESLQQGKLVQRGITPLIHFATTFVKLRRHLFKNQKRDWRV